MVMYKVVTIM